MKLSTLKVALESALRAVIPESATPRVAYRAFKGPVDPPFICYLFVNSEDDLADDTNYFAVGAFDIEVYTDLKNLTLEASVEAELSGLGLVWDKVEDFIDTEDLVRVTYSVEFTPEQEAD